MASTPGTGSNPRFGRDTSGSVPPNVWSNMPHAMSALLPGLQITPWAVNGQHPIYYTPMLPTTPMQVPASQQPPTFVYGLSHQPPASSNFRTYNMRNTTGGFGCEPGYNYLFPAEHTKIHVLKTGSTPPWQLPSNFAVQFHACHVPVNTTVGELMKGFGAKNTVPKKNVITEVCPGGGGKWYKGIEVRGDNADMVKKPIKALGWDATRTGLRGEKKVVYVYVKKD